MQRVNEFVFYELAIKVHRLTEIPNMVKYSQIWSEWSDARDALNEIYRQRPLSFTTPTATKLYRLITEIVPEELNDMIAKIPTGDAVKDEPDLPWWTINQIREAAKEFETVLRNECHLMDTYFVSKKGVYSTVDLVERAHQQIPESIRKTVPDLTRQDFDQAGKCIAFDVPTAAAFHLLRGTEAIIRTYYDLKVPGPKKAKPKMRNWGSYIRLLKGNGAPDAVTSFLTHAKDTYRNPVMHPEEIYTDERVLVLFGICVSIVVMIQTEIDAEKAKPAAIPFPLAIGAAGASNP
jgi:hypothetical protein